MNKPGYYFQALRRAAFRRGMRLFGAGTVTDILDDSLLPETVRRGLNTGISFGYVLAGAVLADIIDRPTRLYYAHYRVVNHLLDHTGLELTSLIQNWNFRAVPVPASQVVDWNKGIAHLNHKLIARRAGLGWLGRNNLLVNPQFGAYVRYATVLSDLPLPESSEFKGDCGDCRGCLTVCPAKALSLEGGYNRKACEDYLREVTRKVGIGQLICGVCVKSCSPDNADFPYPQNKKKVYHFDSCC